MHELSESLETRLNKHHQVNLCAAFFGLLILAVVISTLPLVDPCFLFISAEWVAVAQG